MNHSKKNI